MYLQQHHLKLVVMSQNILSMGQHVFADLNRQLFASQS